MSVIRLIQGQPKHYRMDGPDKLKITLELPDASRPACRPRAACSLRIEAERMSRDPRRPADRLAAGARSRQACATPTSTAHAGTRSADVRGVRARAPRREGEGRPEGSDAQRCRHRARGAASRSSLADAPVRGRLRDGNIDARSSPPRPPPDVASARRAVPTMPRIPAAEFARQLRARAPHGHGTGGRPQQHDPRPRRSAVRLPGREDGAKTNSTAGWKSASPRERSAPSWHVQRRLS